MSKDKTYWNKRYETADYVYGKAPDMFLHGMVSRLCKGKVLDIAMGEGQNAVYLAQKGFEVTGFDFSEVAGQKAKKLAAETGVTIDIQTKNVDFYMFPVMVFDTIVMTHYKPASRFFTDIKKALTQGGTFLCSGWLTEQAGQTLYGEEVTLEECYAPNELLGYLTGLRVLYYEETESDGVSMVRCLAQKHRDRHAVQYGFAKGDKDAKSAQAKAAEALFKKKKS